jgi:hypothetical protein
MYLDRHVVPCLPSFSTCTFKHSNFQKLSSLENLSVLDVWSVSLYLFYHVIDIYIYTINPMRKLTRKTQQGRQVR